MFNSVTNKGEAQAIPIEKERTANTINFNANFMFFHWNFLCVQEPISSADGTLLFQTGTIV
jgi:hypothetical protein